MSDHDMVCSRCGLIVRWWGDIWKHSGGAYAVGCGQKPDPVPAPVTKRASEVSCGDAVLNANGDVAYTVMKIEHSSEQSVLLMVRWADGGSGRRLLEDMALPIKVRPAKRMAK